MTAPLDPALQAECPFCGADAGLLQTRPGIGCTRHSVFCGDCSAEGPVVYSRADAISAWNRRAAASSPPAPPVQPTDEELTALAWRMLEKPRGIGSRVGDATVYARAVLRAFGQASGAAPAPQQSLIDDVPSPEDSQWFGDMMVLTMLADYGNMNDQEREVLTRWIAASQRPHRALAAPAPQTEPSELRAALLRIAAEGPRPSGEKRMRCWHCRNAWVPGHEPERHHDNCALVIARAALGVPASAAPIAPTEQAHPATQPRAWQPIETAPKDGMSVLIANDAPGSIHPREAYYIAPEHRYENEPKHVGWWRLAGSSEDHVHGRTPTHWMPLPAPPPSSVAPSTANGGRHG